MNTQKPLRQMGVEELTETIQQLEDIKQKLAKSLKKVDKAQELVRRTLVEKKSMWVTG